MSAGRDARLFSPAFERNIGPIADALAPRLTEMRRGRALELGSGPGQHCRALAAAFPRLDWTPSDPDPGAVASADAWRAAEGPPNMRPARRLDAAEGWPDAVSDLAPLSLILAVNVTHIAPFAVTEGLVAGAGRTLGPGGLLALYGPFIEDGRETAPSNRGFDRQLRARNAAWGLRRLAAVTALAGRAGLTGPDVARLPANNIMAFWRAPDDGETAPTPPR